MAVATDADPVVEFRVYQIPFYTENPTATSEIARTKSALLSFLEEESWASPAV